ncbi:MAG: type II toxin-antitoxin system RelE/ParE family toxin [bacterium]|nr:type II toxin-antitoxin system RelE/ParE family toxin [bacterium]
MWEIEYTYEFQTWWDSLTHAQQEMLDNRVLLLAEHGPNLKRPVVGKIEGSRHTNMKELRASKDGDLRVLFAFDPRRHVILLLGGNKSRQWKDWYQLAIPQADDLYDAYIEELYTEGLLENPNSK